MLFLLTQRHAILIIIISKLLFAAAIFCCLPQFVLNKLWRDYCIKFCFWFFTAFSNRKSINADNTECNNNDSIVCRNKSHYCHYCHYSLLFWCFNSFLLLFVCFSVRLLWQGILWDFFFLLFNVFCHLRASNRVFSSLFCFNILHCVYPYFRLDGNFKVHCIILLIFWIFFLFIE